MEALEIQQSVRALVPRSDAFGSKKYSTVCVPTIGNRPRRCNSAVAEDSAVGEHSGKN